MLCLLAAAASAQDRGARELVRVEGTRLTSGGRAFHVVGANVAVMHGREQREPMRETLRAAASDGANVVRVWALGEYPEDAPGWARHFAFRIGEEGFVEESYAHLDAVIAEASQLGLRVILVLANRWGDYGGATQYLRWAGVPFADRTVPVLAMSAFWTCVGCERAYRAHAARLVGRTNTITGARYAEDPTILSWELINEAEGAGRSGEEAVVSWIDRNARFVREQGARQLVSAGHIGYSRLRDRALWRRVCALESVSYCDSHAYPLGDPRVTSMARLERWIDDRVHLAQHELGKPLLFGEVGVPANERRVHGLPRARWLDAFFGRALDDGAAGALVWTYLPSAGAERQYAVWAHGARERSTRDLRSSIRRAAARAREREPRPSARLARLRGPIFDAIERARGSGELHRAWSQGILRIDPRRFRRASFEATGTWDGNPGPPHFFGAGAGRVDYRVGLPSQPFSHFTIRLRASSELPGYGVGAGPEDGSELIVRWDGVELGRVTLPPDDGLGGFVELTVDASLIANRRSSHALELEATSEGAGGVCLYSITETGEPAGIELRLEP